MAFCTDGAINDCAGGICRTGGTGAVNCIDCTGGDGASGKNPIFCNANFAAFALASFLFRLVVFG